MTSPILSLITISMLFFVMGNCYNDLEYFPSHGNHLPLDGDPMVEIDEDIPTVTHVQFLMDEEFVGTYYSEQKDVRIKAIMIGSFRLFGR